LAPRAHLALIDALNPSISHSKRRPSKIDDNEPVAAPIGLAGPAPWSRYPTNS
jgi:hypothetical protein